MSPRARSLLALAAAALLHCACAGHRRSGRTYPDTSVSLGQIKGSDIVNLPQIHIGVPDVIVTLPNDCDPNGYLRKIVLGTEVIIGNSLGGAPPTLVPVDANDPQSDVEVHCQVETDEDGNEYRCPGGLVVNSYQFCEFLPQ